MVLSSWHSHCESSLASFDECSTVPSGFFQFVVQLFDEYRYIYPAPDVDVPQRAVMDVDDWTCVFLTRIDARDVHNVNVALQYLTIRR